MKKHILRIILILTLISVLFSLFSCRRIDNEKKQDDTTTSATNKDTKKITTDSLGKSDILVETLKIGKADCIIINSKDNTVVIDAGEDDDSSAIIARLILNKVDKIDYLIITHFDNDHIGAVPDILENYQVDNIIEPDYTPDEPFSDDYNAYKNALASCNSNIMTLSEDISFTLGIMSFDIMTAKGKIYSSNIDNNSSLMIGLRHLNNSFLFAGDIEKDRIEDVVSCGIEHYDYLKVPHHGVNEKNSRSFIDAVSPKYAVITCSEKNPPDVVLVEKLQNAGADVYRTDNGIVYAISAEDGLTMIQ